MFAWIKAFNAKIAGLPFFPAIARIHRNYGQKILTFLAVLPLAGMLIALDMGKLGPRPWFAVLHGTGDMALNLLIACLSITPLMQLFGWRFLFPWRRTLGLLSFFYALMHVFARAMSLGFDGQALMEGLFTNPFLLTGLLAFVLMLPLAITSSKRMIQRLGGKGWRMLHRLVYLIGIFAVIHALMAGKTGYLEFWPQAAALVILLGWRLVYPFLRKAMQKPQG